MKRSVTLISIACLAGTTAFAQELVYEPVNPSFGGNPFNSSHLLAVANAQNDYERPETEDSTQSDLDRFVRSLQSRLLSSLSTQVANAIFGEDAQDSGTIIFGDQTISFVRGLDGIELTITEADGSQTVITVPTLVTDSNDGSTNGAETSPQSKFSLDATGNSATVADATSSLTQPIETPIR